MKQKEKRRKQSTIEFEKSIHSRFPTISKEWHPTQNHPLTPLDFTHGSSFNAWWKCEHGHEWEAPIYRRTIKMTGCPYCSGKKIQIGFNDFASKEPLLAKEWHPTKNYPLLPTEVGRASNKRVWWCCQKGHEWITMISNRTKGHSNCPHCYGDCSKRKSSTKRT